MTQSRVAKPCSSRIGGHIIVAGLAIAGVTGFIEDAAAAPVTFGQFTEVNTATSTVKFTNNGTSATLNTVTTSPGDHISFSFTSIGNLPASLLGPQDAYLKFNNGAGTTTTEAADKSGSGARTAYFQPFDHQVVITFTRSTPFVDHGVNYGSNLLTITLSQMDLFNGDPGLASSGSVGATPQIAFNNQEYSLTYTSDFLKFAPGSKENGSLTFSAVTPGVGLAPGGTFLNSFAGNFTGTFASDPPPSFLVVTEPQSVMIFATGLLGLGLLLRRRA